MMPKEHAFLLSALVVSLIIDQSSTMGCNRTCGGNYLPYPFGFSAGCEIPLNCSSPHGEMFIGGFPVLDVSNDSINIRVNAECNRPFQDLQKLYSQNYAPRSANALLLQNCTPPLSPPCKIRVPNVTTHFGSMNCTGDSGLTCFSRITDDEILNISQLLPSSCTHLLASVSAVNHGLSLKFQVMNLAWWLPGNQCLCSEHADCTISHTPAGPGFRCQCRDGFVGDGYAAGVGCKNGASKDPVQLPLRKVILVIGLSLTATCLGVLFLVIVRQKRRGAATEKSHRKIEDLIQSYQSLTPKRYSYSEVKKMTNSFADRLGEGGFGAVYKGKLQDGHPVAVKVLKKSNGDGEEFINEVATFSRTSHVNIVNLLGFCYERTKRALIYEYMANGSLDKFIYHRDSRGKNHDMELKKLHEIIIGIARGLEYLHRGCNTRIVHFDIKPHNILLNEEFCPKISDFGLAKLCKMKESQLSMLGARGTAGYIAPEVFRNNFRISYKADVYSYGIMVLELVGGRNNVDVGESSTSEIYFPDWIYKRIEAGEVSSIHAATTEEEENMVMKMVLVGLWCIQTNPSDRPSMTKVIEMLEGSPEYLKIPPKPSLSSPPKLTPPEECSSTTSSLALMMEVAEEEAKALPSDVAEHW